MHQIRKRLTYANVMSSIAVFLILGGATALAASHLGKNSVGTKQLKNNAVTTAKLKKETVTTAKIKNGAVTGAKVNLSSLGAVPSATNATNAGNASTVGGQTVTKIFKTLTAGQTNVQVATVAGFAITASCEEADADVTITSPTGPGFVLQSGGIPGSGSNTTTQDYGSGKPGESGNIRVDELSESGDATYGTSSVAGATDTGTSFSGVLEYDYQTFNNSPANTCIVSGQLISG